ncbi:4-alpha-glucanotransferase [bacterium]|nr:4-alpha-glucanotransferase [bacterium]
MADEPMQAQAPLWDIIGKPSRAAGVAVPLSALRSERGFGIGEIPDLKQLIDWCTMTGLRIIQLLPINDTGSQTSPYSARSSLALNPVYLNLERLEGYSTIALKAKTLQIAFNASERCLYNEIRKTKLSLCREIFESHYQEIVASSRFQVFRRQNPWLDDYAHFCVLKGLFNDQWWRDWPKQARDAQPTFLSEISTRYARDCLFHVFLQWQLDQQMSEVHRYAQAASVALKGDIPILISDDSVDVWLHEVFFDTSLHAGAPPDMFTDEGQNWGMPIYNWEALERDGFRWWIARLQHFEKYFDAVRIDHVLGFFRIWAVPATEKTARLGYFVKTQPLTRRILRNLGLSELNIDRLSEPTFTKTRLDSIWAQLPPAQLKKLFCKAGPRDLYRFCPAIRGEQDFVPLCGDNTGLFKELSLLWADRALLKRAPGQSFSFRWNFAEVTAFKALAPSVQKKIVRFLARYEQRQQKMWAQRAIQYLSMIMANTRVLVCAEDLGYVPPVVPPVLKQLGILSLKVDRWTKDYSKNPPPFISPSDYPVSSVCTPSTHDSSTLRGWWEEEMTETEHYYQTLGLPPPVPTYLTTEAAHTILKRNFEAQSVFTILLLQDFFSLTYDFRTWFPAAERINVPGTISPENWSWRMKMDLSVLLGADSFNTLVRDLISNSGRLRNQFDQHVTSPEGEGGPTS